MFGVCATVLQQLPLLLVVVTLARLHKPVAGQGQWNSWGEWGSCTASCGGGIMVRTRTCDVTGTCFGDQISYVPCNKNSCPQDGVWMEWSSWSTCSLSCGGGTQSRERVCEGPYGGGEPCPDDPDTDEQICNQHSCPIDGGWGEWSGPSGCTRTCGGGVTTRQRECDNPAPQNNGRQCLGDSSDYTPCNTDPCTGTDVIDGNWGPWAPVSDCSSTCGSSVRMRSRSCTNPSPANGGAECPGDDQEEFDCQLDPCPQNGAWGWWGAWGDCDVSCGNGSRERSRDCDNPLPMYGGQPCQLNNADSLLDTQEKFCNTETCPAVDGEWGDWKEVGSCSLTCGGGSRLRVRQCDNPAASNGGRKCPGGDPDNPGTHTDTVGCNFTPCPIHGQWSLWSNLSTCSVTCGSGLQRRLRTCSNPAPSNGGRNCSGVATDSTECTRLDCYADGGWTVWSGWGPCTHTCGGGVQSRLRTCEFPAPSGGGQPCLGASQDSRSCSQLDCPALDGQWSLWGSWSDCSATCGQGLMLRLRECDNPAPQHGGEPCPGLDTQSQSCLLQQCPLDSVDDVDGQWTSWTSWSPCSRSCGGGQKRRSRTCTDPLPKGDGKSCDQDDLITREVEIIICGEQECPVGGQWSEWSVWNACSVTCSTGTRTRQRLCDSPPPSKGGQNCLGAGPFADPQTQTAVCDMGHCAVMPLTVTSSTATTSSGTVSKVTDKSTSTTPEVGRCLREKAWDEEVWPETSVGGTVTIKCPLPTIGMVARLCEQGAMWGVADTSHCQSTDFQQLDNEIDDIYNDVGRLTTALTTLCSGQSVVVAGDLLSCTLVFRTLINMNYLLDSRVSREDRTKFVFDVVDGMDGVLATHNADHWYILTKEEEEDDVSVLADLTLLFDEFGQQMALFLQETGGTQLCRAAANIDLCVRQLRCGTTSYRYPPEPEEPTPPPKHERGGWTPPPTPLISHSLMSAHLVQSLACKAAAGPEAEDAETTVPVFVTTVVYSTLWMFLPDENKKAVSPDSPDITGDDHTSQAIGESRTVNAPVISTSLYGPNNTAPSEPLLLAAPLSLTFYHIQEGTNTTCSYIDLSDQKRLYKTDGCQVAYSDHNHTQCLCDHMTSFVVMMQKGHFKEGIQLFAEIDTFVTIACIVSLIVLTALLIFYIVIRMYASDSHFLLLHFLLALWLCHLIILAGGGSWRHQHGCKFVTFAIHYFLTVCFTIQLCVAAHLLRQLRVKRHLGIGVRCSYAVISWGLPLMVCGASLGLMFDDYYSEKLCFFSWNHAAGLAFLVPATILVLATLLMLGWAYIMQKSLATESDCDIGYSSDHQRTTRSAMLRLLVLSVLVYITWTVFSAMYADIWPLFMLLDIALHVYLCVAYGYKDQEVQAAVAARKLEFKAASDERRRRKRREPSWVTHMKLGKKAGRAEGKESGLYSEVKQAIRKKQEQMLRFVYLPAVTSQQVTAPAENPQPAADN